MYMYVTYCIIFSHVILVMEKEIFDIKLLIKDVDGRSSIKWRYLSFILRDPSIRSFVEDTWPVSVSSTDMEPRIFFYI